MELLKFNIAALVAGIRQIADRATAGKSRRMATSPELEWPIPDRDYRIQFPRGVEKSVIASAEAPDLYRLREQPIGSDAADFDDLIRAREVGPDKLKFLGIEVQSHLSRTAFIASSEWIESNEIVKLLEKVSDNGGYWQRDAVGCLSISFDRTKYDPTEDLKVITTRFKKSAD